MTAIKDVLGLPTHIRGILISLFVIMPYWYLDIRLLSIDYRILNTIEMPIVLAFALTSSHLILNFILAFLMQQVFWKNAGDKLSEAGYMFFWTLLFSVPLITILSFIAYIKAWNLISLIQVIFGISACFCSPFLIVFLIRDVIMQKES